MRTTLGATKGRLIRCTVSGLTPNLAAVLLTPGLPGVAGASRIRFSSVRAIGNRPSQNNARASRVGAAGSRLTAMSILPEPSEPVRRHRCVAHGRGNRAVTEIVLNCPRVVPVISELVAAGMPQHVAVDQERETISLAGSGNHPLIARNAQWRIPLGNEDVNARGLPLQPAQRAQLPRGQWLPSAYTALGAPHVQRRGLPVDVIPT